MIRTGIQMTSAGWDKVLFPFEIHENSDTLYPGDKVKKEICFVSEGVPIRHNVKHLGLQGHVWAEGLIYATGKGGVGLYVIVPHDRLVEGPGWIMLLDRKFRIRDVNNIQMEILEEVLQ